MQRIHERYWALCDALEHVGYTPEQAVTIATATLFGPDDPEACDLGEPGKATDQLACCWPETVAT
jgi:hypothetical protein